MTKIVERRYEGGGWWGITLACGHRLRTCIGLADDPLNAHAECVQCWDTHAAVASIVSELKAGAPHEEP